MPVSICNGESRLEGCPGIEKTVPGIYQGRRARYRPTTADRVTVQKQGSLSPAGESEGDRPVVKSVGPRTAGPPGILVNAPLSAGRPSTAC